VLRQRQASRGRRGADPARAQKVKYAVRRHWYARRLGTCRLSFRPHVYSTSPCAVRPRLPDAVDERAGTRECRSWLLLTRDIYRSHSRTPACHSEQSSCSYPSLRMTLASSARAAAQKRNRRPAAVTALIANGHRGRYNNPEPRQTTGARGRGGAAAAGEGPRQRQRLGPPQRGGSRCEHNHQRSICKDCGARASASITAAEASESL